MNSAKRIISLLMCAVMLTVAFSGCTMLDLSIEPTTQPTTVAPVVSRDEIGYTLAYLRSDSLNPYECESETNRNIVSLMYDPLFNTNNEFRAIGVIAESYKYTDSNVISVKFKSGLKFTDGSALTADDIVYSFVLAKKSKVFTSQLNNISDCSAGADSTVIFTLKSANPYEVSNLTFPIIKKNSDKGNSGSDAYSASLPVGSGRYKLVEEKDTKKLVSNKTRLGSYIPKYSFIGLKAITEVSSIPSLFDLNEVDFYTESFSEGVYKRYSGKSSTFETTNFVYVGINSETTALHDSNVRRAISLLIDRSNIASVSFSDFAVPASTPYHPSFYAVKNCSVPPTKTDKESAIELLSDAGFDKISDWGIRYSSEKGALNLRLLVNKDNSFKLATARHIQQTLAQADIRVTLKEYSFKEYVEAVDIGAYDLYIGEVSLPSSFALNGFFNESGGYSFGIDPECKSAADYKLLLDGEKNMQEFLDTFSDELPFIPILYRKGITVRSSKIKTNTKTIINDYLYNIHEWTAE